MLATQLVLDPMAASGGGVIINVASVAGLGTTSHDAPEYAVAKAGVLAGRIMVCRGGAPSRLLPLVDWQTA
jgi:NAD(P)-dependent dehydrogenase (short-subunit alcohol dehydrogenase family)